MAVRPKSPGITVSETTGTPGIRGQDTGIIYIEGVSQWGAIGSPIEILSEPDAKTKLGDYVTGYFGRQCVEAAFQQRGVSKVLFARVAHYTAGALQAVKASHTVTGYDPETEDQAKVNTVKWQALAEGTLGNRLKIDTVKASGGPLVTSDFDTGDEKIEVTDSSDFEVGDIVEVVDTVVHYCRIIVTAIDSVNHYLYCKAQTLAASIVQANSTVKTCSTHKVRTALATGESLESNATQIDLANASAVNIGAVLTVVDTRIGGGLPNNISLKVTNKSVNTIYFADIGTITTIAAANSEVVSQEFNATVYLDTVQLETEQKFLSMSSANEKDYIGNKFVSAYVEAIDQASSEGDLGDIPESLTLQLLASGDDGLTSLADADFIGSEAVGHGFHQYNTEAKRFAQLLVADSSSAAVQNAALEYAADRGLWYEGWVPFDTTAANAIVFKRDTMQANSNYGAMSWPNVKWLNVEKGVIETLPAAAFIAGNNAETWSSVGKGPWTQPAGVENGVLRSVQGLEGTDANGVNETDSLTIRDSLYEENINPLYLFPSRGFLVYGIRTLETDGDFPQKGERCTFLYVEHSIREGIPWSVFSNIDDVLKGRVKRSAGGFLRGVWNQGGLKGATTEEAYIIDLESLNTDLTEDAGEFWVKIGLATKKGAEFVFLVFSKLVGQG